MSYGAYTQMDAINCHKGVSVGPSYSYSSAYTPSSLYGIGNGYFESFKSKVGYHTLMLNVKIQYYQNSIVKLYAHAGAGAVISHMMPKFGDSYNKGYFAGQISPLGAEVEFYPGASVFGELGFGAQGLIQLGAKYSF